MASRAAAFAMCEELASSLSSHSLAPDAAAAVEVALQCIQTAFDVDFARRDHRDAWSLRARGSSLAAAIERALSSPSSSSSSSTSSSDTSTSTAAAAPEKAKVVDEEARAEAEKLKALGNVQMKDKNFEGAIASYSRAIDLNPTVAVYFANRAAAYLCVRDNEAAATDSERSIALDETYPKGHSRLGTARLALGQYAEAAKALQRALELEPDNERTRQELQKAEERLAPSPSSGQSVTPAAQPAPGAGAGARGMPSMGGGMPDFASLLSNPAMMQMANQMMSSGMLSELMSNPMMANMAASMMGGGGGGGGGGGAPDLASISNAARAFAASNPDVVDRMRSTLGENGSVEALDDDSSNGTRERGRRRLVAPRNRWAAHTAVIQPDSGGALR